MHFVAAVKIAKQLIHSKKYYFHLNMLNGSNKCCRQFLPLNRIRTAKHWLDSSFLSSSAKKKRRKKKTFKTSENSDKKCVTC